MTSRTVDEAHRRERVLQVREPAKDGRVQVSRCFNALSQLSADEKRRGVLAFSSGNLPGRRPLGKLLGNQNRHRHACRRAESEAGATRGYGAEVVTYQKHENREQVAAKLAKEEICPSSRLSTIQHIVAGQGTAAKELFGKPGRSMCCSCPAAARASCRAARSPRASSRRSAA